MADDDIRRIMDGLSEINLRMSGFGERVSSLETTVKTLDTKIDKYNGLKDRMASLEGEEKRCTDAIAEIKSNCKAVQDNKSKTRIPWQNVIPNVITGILMIIAGAIFALILK